MTIEEVKNSIKNEIDNKIPSRFPLRLIFVNNMEEYLNIKHYLTDNCDKIISLGDDDICETEDIYPNFGKLKTKINNYTDKHILLLSMGEYFRFSLKRELTREKSSFPSFFRDLQAVNSKTRVFVLLFAAYNLFEQIIPTVDERQEGHIWIIDEKNNTETYNIFVFSDKYKTLPQDYTKGLKSWLNNWEKNLKKKNNIVISTRLINNVVNSNDIIGIKVITNIFDYICTRIDNSKNLKKDWLTDEQWEHINSQIKIEKDFNKVILNILNIQNFDQYRLFAQWNSLSNLHKKLVLIWYKLNPDNSYCATALNDIDDISEITTCLRDYLITNYDEKWFKERNNILILLKDTKYDNNYFERLFALDNPKIQLSLLTFSTHEEQTFALKIISDWLRNGASNENIKDAIGTNYTLFQQYFFDETYSSIEIKAYLKWYKYNKIINRFPKNERQIQDFNTFNSRFSILNKSINEDTFVIWVDGMGIEWLSLIYGQFKEVDTNLFIEKPIIATACLPTETEFNRQWDDYNCPYEKLDKLDILAHKGIPDDNNYFSCIAAQFEIIKEVVYKAVSFLKKYERVIITADHGSSRLAALAFHTKPGFKAPENAKVGSFGRFCELPEGAIDTVHADDYEYNKNGNKAYFVIKNYEHFTISGKAVGKDQNNEALSGEIHGGKTPEEYLVPIIIINRNTKTKKTININFTPETQIIYKKGNIITIQLDFNINIDTLEANIGSIKGECKKISDKSWEIKYRDLDRKIYSITLTANGHLLETNASLEVKSKGIAEEDYFGGYNG